MIKELEKVLEEVFENNGYDLKYCKINKSNRPEVCDFQINSVFQIAKELHTNPIEIGEQLVDAINELENFSNYFESIVFVKPGFINIKVSNNYINEKINIVKDDKDLGIKKIEENITCIVDYGGPNIAKPLHVGHMRPAIIGQSIYEILKEKGYKVIGDVHLGDSGLQMGQVIYGLKEMGKKPEEITIDLLQEIYPKMSALSKVDEKVAEACREITKEFQDGNEEYREYFKYMYDISLNDIKRLYSYLGVYFDYWYGELDSYKYMDDLMAFLYKKGVVEEDDGAKIVRIVKDDDKKQMPPLLLKGKSGAYLYATTDVATIYQRMQDFHPDYILYVVDDRQRLHFEQVFRACEKSGLTEGVKLEHNYFGTINSTDGKPFKTRSGEILKLDDLIAQTKDIFISKKESNKEMSEEDIDIIVNAILKFADLQNNREKNYIFDMDKFADVNGKTGPYILYTAVRIKKLVASNMTEEVTSFGKIYNEYDRNLKMKLLEINNVVTKAADERMPHYIADYLYDLCVLTNTFYQNNNIGSIEDAAKKKEWVNLLKITYSTLDVLLKLLVIDIPSEM